MLPRRLGRLAAARGYAICLRRHASVLVQPDTIDGAPTGVHVITLNNPNKLNPMTVDMGDAIVGAVDELESLPPAELKAVVLTGAGRAFSAGGDMAFLSDRKVDTPTNNAKVMLAFYKRYLVSIRRLPVPIVACINGPAIGAGLCFAMGADVRYTHASASLGFTFVGLGLHPGMGCTHTIASVAGTQVASKMLLSGEVVKGDQAQALGLVVESLPDAGAAWDESIRVARKIASQSPLAVRSTVKTLRSKADEGLDLALMREADAQAQ
eukprot:581641-Prymnesium_polylepis.1